MERVSSAQSSLMFEMDSTIVESSLETFVTANSGLVMLEGKHVILRRDYRQLNQLKIMSGGCSGFEPMCIGFVGRGMLTAAVVGDLFCSPSCTTILTAIRELAANNPYGVLIILMNHPVNRINFLLAVECAMRESIRVKVLFLADDSSGIMCENQRRKGLAGVALLFKIAGAMADQKRPLEEVYDICLEVSSLYIATIALSVSKHTDEAVHEGRKGIGSIISNIASTPFHHIPDTGNGSHRDSALSNKTPYNSSITDSSFSSSKSPFTSDDGVRRTLIVQEDLVDKRVTDLGVHSFTTINDLARIVLGYIIDGTESPYSLLKEDCDLPIVLLVNNYGLMMNIELNALVKQLLVQLKSRYISVKRIYIGTVMKSRTMDGFSVTAMKVNEDMIACLDHPVTVSGWPTTILQQCDNESPLPIRVKPYTYFEPEEPKELGPILDIISSKKIYRALDSVCMTLTACEEQMNKMGSVCSNSLYGTHLKMGLHAISEALYNNKLKINCPYAMFSQLSTMCSEYIPNTAGSLYSIFFDGVSQSFLGYLNETKIVPHMWTYALESGINALEEYSGAKRGERTMLDALYPMLETMKKSLSDLMLIADAAEIGCINTVNPDVKAHSVPHPSTHTVGLWARAVVEALTSFKPTNEQNLQDIDNFWDIVAERSSSALTLM